MDQGGTWHEGGPRPIGHIVLDGDPAPLPKKGQSPPNFRPLSMDQDATCVRIPLGTKVGLSLSDIVLDGDPAPPPLKGQSHTHNFRPMYIVVKRMDG